MDSDLAGLSDALSASVGALADLRDGITTLEADQRSGVSSSDHAVSLVQVARRVLRLMNFGDDRVAMDLKIEAETHFVFGKSAEIHAVLYNLLDNAARAARESVVAPFVSIRISTYDKTEGWQRLEIEDNGPGIDSRMTMESVLAAGRSVSTSPGGWGRGLLFACRIVDALGGKVDFLRIVSHPGTVVRLTMRGPKGGNS
jgi:signal transduction histidine kinase